MSDSRKFSLFSNLKWWQATILIVTILLAAEGALSQGVNLWREGERVNLALPYSYIISTDGTEYLATNGTTGQIDFQSTNASYVFNSAIQALPTFVYRPSQTFPYDGGSICIKSGHYFISNTITVDRPLKLCGEGPRDGCVDLELSPNANCRMLNVSTYWTEIDDITFEGNYTTQSGGDFLLYFAGGYPVMNNCFVYRAFGSGIYLDAGDFLFTEVFVEFCQQRGWVIQCGQNGQLVSCTAWNNKNVGMVWSGQRGTMEGCRIINNNGGSGLFLSGVLDFQVLGGYVEWNNQTGIDIYNSNYTALSDVEIRDNSQTTNNGYAGIWLRGSSSHDTVEGCTIYSSFANKQSNAILEANTADYNVILGNTLYGDVGAEIVRVGSNTIVSKNSGFVTENSGSAEGCVNGTWIAHGLAGAPNGELSLIMSGNNYINSTCWIMEPTIIASNSTMFQISLLIDNSGTITAVTPTNSVTIDWAVQYKP